MKTVYDKPCAEFVRFDNEDIITASCTSVSGCMAYCKVYGGSEKHQCLCYWHTGSETCPSGYAGYYCSGSYSNGQQCGTFIRDAQYCTCGILIGLNVTKPSGGQGGRSANPYSDWEFDQMYDD